MAGLRNVTIAHARALPGAEFDTPIKQRESTVVTQFACSRLRGSPMIGSLGFLVKPRRRSTCLPLFWREIETDVNRGDHGDGLAIGAKGGFEAPGLNSLESLAANPEARIENLESRRVAI
jgi:hypothetical protein